jgi:hypothetical protein
MSRRPRTVVVFCLDEFGPLNLQPHPGPQWAAVGGHHADPDPPPRRRRRATYTRPHGVRYLLAAYDLSTDRLYGHVKATKDRTEFLAFCRYVRSLHHPPHLSTNKDQRVGNWAAANNVELADTPHYASWLNPIEAQFQALRDFCLDGPDHRSHREQASMIRRYIVWRNRNADNQNLCELVKRANLTRH